MRCTESGVILDLSMPDCLLPYFTITQLLVYYKWASSRENLSSGFPKKRVSNQSPQLQRLARKLKFHL